MWTLSDFYLFCLVVGGLWSLITVVGAGLGAGHHGGHQAAHHGSHPIGHHSHTHSSAANHNLLSGLFHPSSTAVFLAWFGGAGYLFSRHTGLTLWLELAAAVLLGLLGAFLFALFFGWLQSREQPLVASDYQLPGVLGRVSATIRPGGVGEIIYLRNGARTPLPVRSESDELIGRGEEVVVTRYERGIAYVRSFQGEPH